MDMISLEATALGGTNSMLVGVDSNCRHIHVKFLKNGSKVVLQPDWKRRDMNAVTSSVQFLGQDVDVGTLPAERHEEFLQLLNEFKDVFSVPGDTTRLPA